MTRARPDGTLVPAARIFVRRAASCARSEFFESGLAHGIRSGQQMEEQHAEAVDVAVRRRRLRR